jgi:hypothetical protein
MRLNVNEGSLMSQISPEKALISWITGEDSSYLAEFLLAKDFAC